MTIQTINTASEELIVIGRSEFESLMEKAGVLPPKVAPDRHGGIDARASVNISIARSLISDRIKRGWTQTELARRAGVRLETIGRIEAGKHVARRETLLKLDRALGTR